MRNKAQIKSQYETIKSVETTRALFLNDKEMRKNLENKICELLADLLVDIKINLNDKERFSEEYSFTREFNTDDIIGNYKSAILLMADISRTIGEL